jgi:hypothetical protein
MSTPTTGRDTKAAFLGLVLGALVLLGVMYTIVHLTNSHFEKNPPAHATH